jgi:hypothetical protein
MLTRAASLDEFLARPLRRYVVGKSSGVVFAAY